MSLMNVSAETNSDDLEDFVLEGGDELMNSAQCPHCGRVFYLDEKLAWVDKKGNVCKCPACGEEVKT